ncbi:MAG: glycosyltransferase family A protein [Gammaproteobacteria bacterium]|nr:glycosyltransferase family A protein [Gammaproteobacteria bacterium]
MTRTAVIIPVFNRAGLIGRALDHVGAQTQPPDRLIVVDDASDDGTPDAVRQWQRREQRPFETQLLVQETNRGPPAARNAGLSQLADCGDDCEWVCFLDSDDFVPPDFLEKTVAALAASPRAVAASTDCLMQYALATPDGVRQAKEFIRLSELAENPWQWFFAKGAGVFSCTVFRAECVRELGGFNETLLTCDDSELFTRIANLGEWLHVPHCTVTITRGDADEHLYHKYNAYLRDWARVREDCLARFGARAHIPKKLRCKVMGHSWCLAGMQMIALERFGEAGECFRRSLAWRVSPFNRSWPLLALLPLARPAMPLLRRTGLAAIFADHFSHKKRRLLKQKTEKLPPSESPARPAAPRNDEAAARTPAQPPEKRARQAQPHSGGQMKTAVIIPVFNRAGLIDRVLDHIGAQTQPPDRLIVVDDASDDGTPDAVRQWQQREQRPFKTQLLVQETNRGAPAARNCGLAQIAHSGNDCGGDCEFVYFLDSDDFPPPDFLEKTATALAASPRAVAASTDRLVHYELTTPGGVRDAEELIHQNELAENPWQWFFIHGAGVASCTLFRAEYIRELGGFSGTLPTGHDSELFTRLANLGEWLHVPDCAVTFTAGDARDKLHRRHKDYLRIWACIREDCLERFGAREHIPKKLRRRVMGDLWRSAGLQMIALERFGEAGECFRRSLAWRVSPRNRAWTSLALLPFARPAMPLLRRTGLAASFADHFSGQKKQLLKKQRGQQ